MLNEIEQGSREWHDWRSQGIGASEAPDIMGVGYLTPHQLWSERLGLTPKRESNSSMSRGRELEPLARQKFITETGIEMHPDLRVHPGYNWMRCSLDGISNDGESIVEIKCPNRERHQMALDGVIPPEYFPQIQHQIAVCGVDFAFYFSFNGTSGKVLEVPRDDKYIISLISKESEFWGCLQNLESPELTDRDFVLKDSHEWMLNANICLEADHFLKIYEAKKEAAKKKLIELAEGKNCKGSGIKLSRSMRKGLVDYKAIPELKSIDLEKFRKAPIETWRIGIE